MSLLTVLANAIALARAASRCPGARALCIGAILAPALLTSSAAAQFPVIELTVITPRVAQAGTSLELRVVGGTHLDAVDRLVFSDPRITAEVVTEEPPAAEAAAPADGAAPEADATAEAAGEKKPSPKYGHFRVTIPADVAPGRYELRAIGAYGISNPRVFTVAAGQCVSLEAVSQVSSEPTPLDERLATEESLIVNHQATAARIDYFRLSSSPKHARRIAVDAQRIDSRMIAQLRLVGPDGRAVQTARGADGFDPAVVIPAGQAGDFTIAVHDFLYRGGDAYFYALRVEPDDGAETTAASGEAVASGMLPDADLLEAAAIAVPAESGDGAEVQRVNIGADDEPMVLTPPCVIESRFADLRGDHVFHFSADEGTQLAIEVRSQRLGQPTDPRLVLERQEIKPEGEVVWHSIATEDDPPVIGDAAMRLRSKDPNVAFTAPATATYRIKVRNLDTGRSLITEPRYRLALRKPSPGFSLVAMLPHPHSDPAQSRPRGCQIMRGEVQPIRVLAVRHDAFAGAIQLSIPELPAGLSCKPVQIAANQNEAHLMVIAAADAASYSGEAQIVGKATQDDGSSSQAVAAAFIWGSGELRDFVRSRLATKLMLSVTDQQQTPLSIQLGGDDATGGKPGTDVSIPIKLNRGEGAATPVVLRPRNLPPGVTAAEVTIPADQSEGTLAVKIAADAKPGSYSFWLQGESKVKFKAITQTDAAELTVFVSSTTANIELTESP